MGVSYNKLKVRIFSPVVLGRKGEYYQLLYDLLSKGYEQVKVDGNMKRLRNRIELAKYKKHTIDVLVDELYLSEFKEDKGGSKERLSEAVERALSESDGLVRIETPNEERLISARFMCPYDGFSYPEIEPRLFSFNSPYLEKWIWRRLHLRKLDADILSKATRKCQRNQGRLAARNFPH